ncbi:hypothetical protein WH47_05498, partial [Habropoda laboriosa]
LLNKGATIRILYSSKGERITMEPREISGRNFVGKVSSSWMKKMNEVRFLSRVSALRKTTWNTSRILMNFFVQFRNL